MCWARTRRPKTEPTVESNFTAEERRNYEDAVRLLKRQVIATAIMIGQGTLEGMERGVAEVRLQMVLEQSSVPGFVAPEDRYHALRWFNWSVKLINATRNDLGCRQLFMQAGFRSPLVADGHDGWK